MIKFVKFSVAFFSSHIVFFSSRISVLFSIMVYISLLNFSVHFFFLILFSCLYMLSCILFIFFKMIL